MSVLENLVLSQLAVEKMHSVFSLYVKFKLSGTFYSRFYRTNDKIYFYQYQIDFLCPLKLQNEYIFKAK